MSTIKTIPFGAELTVYGQNLSDDLPLPKNASVTTNAQMVGGTMSAIELVVKATSAISLATAKMLHVTVEDSDDATNFVPTGWKFSLTAPKVNTDDTLTRFCFSSSSKKYVRCTVATDDAAAVGSIALELVYLPR